MHAICIIMDDLASEPKFHRNYGPISELFTRGRHFFIQSICSSQKWKLLSPTARVNAHWIVAFKLRNRQDLDGLLQELTAIYPIEVLKEMCEEAVNDQPYSFLFINLKKPKEEMFSIRFEEILNQVKKMGALLSQIMNKLLGGGGEREAHAEVDHNACICCGTVNIMEPDASDDEKEFQKEKNHGDKDIVHRFKN